MRLVHVATVAILAGATQSHSQSHSQTLSSHAAPEFVDAAASSIETSRIEVGVDPRFELFSILERLAGAPEYGVAATPYARAADVWFAPHADADAVRTLRGLRAENGIGYDAALTLAAQLDEELQPMRPLSPCPKGSTGDGRASISPQSSMRSARSPPTAVSMSSWPARPSTCRT